MVFLGQVCLIFRLSHVYVYFYIFILFIYLFFFFFIKLGFLKFPTCSFEKMFMLIVTIKGFGAKERLEDTPEQKEARIQKISDAVKTILVCLGEDPTREGLLSTPERYAKAMLFFTKGYEENVQG